MKNFKDWGIKQRIYKDYNYNAIWSDLKTIRLGKGIAHELPCDESEFYDIGINTLCNLNCPFCYVSASSNGKNYENICETWTKWMDKFYEKKNKGILKTNKPFQIAIGSTGEPTIHPEFCKFLEIVFNTNVVPNYTTNGLVLNDYDNPNGKYYNLAKEIIKATQKYVGGVAVSFGNEYVRNEAHHAVDILIEYGNTNVNIHHIISNKQSVDDFISEWISYGDKILYHVLLPLMPAGRSKKGVEKGTFEYLENKIKELNIKNVAFGAHFIDTLKTSKIKTWLYPSESFSKNIILEKDLIKITPSSFNLNPIKEIDLT